MFCRVRAMPLGPSGFSSIAFQAYAVSFASPGRTIDEVRDRPQRGQVLDRLVGGAVLAQADRVVGPHVDDRRLHHGGQADRAAHVVAEGEERAAVRAGGPVQGDAVEDRAHRVLADPEVQRAAVGLGVPHLRGDRLRAERVRALHRGVVALGEVRRAAPQLGQHVGQRLEHLAGGLAGGDALLVGLPRRQRLLPAHRQVAAEHALEQLLALGLARGPGVVQLGPLGVRLRPALHDLAGVRDHLVGDLEGLVRVEAEDLLDGPDLVGSPSAEPCALPVFISLGAGKPITVRSRMNDGRSGLGLARSPAPPGCR